MKNGRKLMGAVIALSALSGANTFSKTNNKKRNTNGTPLHCSIDSKVRQEIKKGIKEYGHDDSVVLEIPAECKKGSENWKKGYFYVDVKTAKSIQRNPDANMITGKKGAKYIAEGESYVMNNSTYSLEANFNGNKDVNDLENNLIYGNIQKNLKPKKEEKVATKKPAKKSTKPIVQSRPKAEMYTGNKPTVETAKKSGVVTYGTPKGEITVSVNNKEELSPKKEATSYGTPKGEVIIKESKKSEDKDIEKSINDAISKYI